MLAIAWARSDAAGSGCEVFRHRLHDKHVSPDTMTTKSCELVSHAGELTRHNVLGADARRCPWWRIVGRRRSESTPRRDSISQGHQDLSRVAHRGAAQKAICFGGITVALAGCRCVLPVSRNNWAVSPRNVKSFSLDQQALIGEIIESVLADDWPRKLQQQAKDDTGRTGLRTARSRSSASQAAAGANAWSVGSI